jgi:cysteinyl-tRNA synthetase
MEPSQKMDASEAGGLPEIRVSNTLSAAKEALRTLEAGHVRMYVCGVTVYAPCHVGHARAGMAFDIVLRHLLHRGYRVTFVKNFTDVDDKIIERATKEGVSWKLICDRYIADFYGAMDAIHLLRPDHEPRCSDYIPQIVEMTRTLVEKGHAYVVEGDVYFDVATKPDYGRLSKRKLDEQEEGARVAVDSRKRHPFDFALWKAAKPGEPAWDSPWGPGRPGWHIECSAMGTALLGTRFDLHGGGIDLVFPHHENEIAQSECALGVHPWVPFWMHNGHLTIDAAKMSKSVGNIFRVEDIVARFHPESLRMFLLSAHYKNPQDFNEEAMLEAEQRLERLYGTLLLLDQALGGALPRPGPHADGGWRREQLYRAASPDPLAAVDPTTLDGPTRGLHAQIAGLMGKIDGAMDDDFNTAAALGFVFDFIRRINKFLSERPELGQAVSRALAAAARDRLMQVGALMGIFHEEPAAFFDGLRARRLKFLGVEEGWIREAIGRRAAARATKDFAAADAVRAELAEKGIGLKDGPEGTSWVVERGIGAVSGAKE